MSRLGDGCVAGGSRNPETRDSRLRARFSLSSFPCLFAQLDDWVVAVVVLWPLRRLLVSLNLFVTLPYDLHINLFNFSEYADFIHQ